MSDLTDQLEQSLPRAAGRLNFSAGLRRRGVVRRVGDGVAWVTGLEEIGFEEMVRLDCGALGIALDLAASQVGVVLLSQADKVLEGDGASGLGRLPDLPVGPATRGRILDPLGFPLDEGPALNGAPRLPLFRPALEIIERQAVSEVVWTGITAVDAAIPIGRGQRELIIGDRNVGKTALGLDIIAAQHGGEMQCVYVVIGQPMSRVLTIRDTLDQADCLAFTTIIAADASQSPGLQYLAPYAGASVAEWYRDNSGDALIVFDDLTKHADAYRELALLLNRPPGREAYPGDIFHIQAELLERSSPRRHDLGGGSVTSFPIVETTEGDISTYIPTNLISITDGQIYLDTSRFERNQRPAIDVGRSVSRIGSVVQPPPLRRVARNLRIALSRFESLEDLTRVGMEMDLGTQSVIQRGRRIRQALCQPRLSPRSLDQQVLTLWVLQHGIPPDIPQEQTVPWLQSWLEHVTRQRPQLRKSLAEGKMPDDDWESSLVELLQGMPTDDNPLQPALPYDS